MPSAILDTILDAVGDTPMVRLSRLGANTRTPIAAKVDLVEPMGVTTLLHASFAGEDLKVLSLDRPRLAPGEPIRLDLLRDKLHVFDAKSEQRLA